MRCAGFPRLIFITDRRRTEGRTLQRVVEMALRGGADAVQLREKDLSEVDYLDLAEAVFDLTKAHDAALILNGRPELLEKFPGAGLHVGKKHPPPELIRLELNQPEILIGYSAHSIPEALEAAERGADYVSFSPVFETTKPDAFLPPTGLEPLRSLVEQCPIPVTALGGIEAGNLGLLRPSGVRSVSVVSAISRAPDPERAARELKEEIASWR